MSDKAPWITYRPELKVLDCTIRDGGLVNAHRFSDAFVGAVYRACVDAGALSATVRAALLGLRRRHPSSVVLAVPVAPPDSLAELQPLVDRVVCLDAPADFYAVGAHYHHFPQVEDEDAERILAEARKGDAGGA